MIVGVWLGFGWQLMLGQRVSNEQSNVGPTKYVAVGPQPLGFGWRMVSVLAGRGRRSGDTRGSVTYQKCMINAYTTLCRGCQVKVRELHESKACNVNLDVGLHH